VEILAVRRQFRDRGNHFEVRIATLDLEAAKLLAVECQTIGIVIVVRREKFPPLRLFGGDLRLQSTVVEYLVADEGNPRHARGRPFIYREDEIDTVLRPL